MDLEERKRIAQEFIQKDREEREQREKQLWENLPRFDGDHFNVPPLPIPITEYHVNRLVEAGAIPKEDLVDHKWYIGDYRNTKIALWEENNNGGLFRYLRTKFGHRFWDECNHFQDDDGFALFVPIREATEEEIQTNLNDE